MMENIRGLTADEVIKRRLQYGINVIPESWYGFLKLVLRQLKGIFNLLLMVAAIIAFIFGEPVDGFFILFLFY